MAKILIADDDTLSLEEMASTISAEGHEVLCATDGQQACELTLSQQPDLVILGASLPIFTGYETCALIRNDPSNPPTLPIVIVTSVDFDSRMLDKVGATKRLPKNHSVIELRDLLVSLLGPLAVP